MAVRIYGNRALKTLPGQATRPTASRVREAVFNIWRDRVGGCHWLDICAGLGTMGAEALARGATTVTGIEKSGRAWAVVRDNWRAIARPEQIISPLRGDAIALLGKLTDPFDLIYFDPPYDAGDLYDRVPPLLAQRRLLAPNGELAIEYDPHRWHPIAFGPLHPIRTKDYGNTAIAFYRWHLDGQTPESIPAEPPEPPTNSTPSAIIENTP